jgi:triosephosphate isomerase
MQLDAASACELAAALAQAKQPNQVALGVFPSHPHLIPVAAALSGKVWLGAQDVDPHPPGAVTGGVSAEQLREIGARLVLVGHSERRQLFEHAVASWGPQDVERLLLAYEPVWSIGTGVNAGLQEVQPMHALLRGALRTRFGAPAERIPILYGGSVRPENAGPYFELPDVDGALVGGASLRIDSFLAIVAGCAAAI